MPRYQGPAFLLRTWDVGESDLLVSFVERERGKRRGIAKGAKRSRKRFGGLRAPMVLVRLEYVERPGQGLVRIEGCTLLRYHASLAEHLGKLLVASCMLETLERVLPEGEGGVGYFPLLQEALDRLDREETTGYHLWIFLLQTFALLGLEPQLSSCIHCRRRLAPAGVFGFSVPLGGPVCGACIGKGTSTDRVHAGTLRVMRQWLRTPYGEVAQSGVPVRNAVEAAGLIERFYLHHVARELRSLRVMKDVAKRSE